MCRRRSAPRYHGSVRCYFAYIVASYTRTLYTGVTNDLRRRSGEHRTGSGSKFTSRYKAGRLVHYEEFSTIRAAIAREKQIKGWSRKKKIALIEETNPDWLDLATDPET